MLALFASCTRRFLAAIWAMSWRFGGSLSMFSSIFSSILRIPSRSSDGAWSWCGNSTRDSPDGSRFQRAINRGIAAIFSARDTRLIVADKASPHPISAPDPVGGELENLQRPPGEAEEFRRRVELHRRFEKVAAMVANLNLHRWLRARKLTKKKKSKEP